MQMGSRWWLAVALAVYFFGALFWLRSPGLHFDELYFANVALGNLDGTFVFADFLGLPLYSMSYLGALKGWLYWPIFKAFGVSVESVRLPAILMGSAFLAGGYELLRRRSGPRPAAIAVLLLSVHATFVWAIKTDFGPVVLDLLFQLATVTAFVTGAPSLYLGLLAALGLWNKVTFLWWLAGGGAAAFVFYPEHRRRLALAALVPLAYLAAWGYGFRRELGADFHPFVLAERFVVAERELARLLDGSGFFNVAFTPLTALGGNQAFALGAGLLLSGAWLAYRRRERFFGYLVLHILFTFLFAAATPRSQNYWHFFSLLPLLAVLLALLADRWRKAGLALAGAVILGLGSVQVYYLRHAHHEPWRASFSTAIYGLIDYCRASGKKCVALDWGIHGQLLAMLGSTEKAAPYLPDAPLDPAALYVTMAQNYDPGPSHHEEWYGRLRKEGWRFNLEKEVAGRYETIYRVYGITRAEVE